MQATPSFKEITSASKENGIQAIPYPDLRWKGKQEYGRQLTVCKEYSCDNLSKEDEIEAAGKRAKACREQRIKVRGVFAQAIGRIKSALKTMKPGDPSKPGLETILAELEGSQANHDKAIAEANKAFLKCEEKIKKVKSKRPL